MCRLLGVSRNAYYQYCLYQQGRLPDPEHEGMLAAVKEVAESSGYSYGSRMKAKSVTDALRLALWRRRPAAGLIVHSDRSSQYASKAYRRLLKAYDFVGSMSRKGDCWDNAVAESFFASLKKERVQWKHYQTRAEAQQDILDYIAMFYNSRRLHSTLVYSSPNDFESAMAEMKEAA